MHIEIRKLGVYDFEIFGMDPVQMRMKQTRRRMLGVGVNVRKASLQLPVHRWVEYFERCSVAMPETCLSSFLLDEESECMR